ncbi:hypothetical protein Tco_0450005 [Tanacetum coccineum]
MNSTSLVGGKAWQVSGNASGNLFDDRYILSCYSSLIVSMGAYIKSQAGSYSPWQVAKFPAVSGILVYKDRDG